MFLLWPVIEHVHCHGVMPSSVVIIFFTLTFKETSTTTTWWSYERYTVAHVDILENPVLRQHSQEILFPNRRYANRIREPPP